MEDILAPENFSMVEAGVYRSAFPRSKNNSFIKSLRLRSVVPLIPEDYPKQILDFYASQNIKLLTHGLDGNKWPFKEINLQEFMKCLLDIIKQENRPLLIHCNKGKHRTGSVIGCLRKIRGWALSSIFNEYLSFAAPKSRLEDQIFIEAFSVADFWSFVSKQDNYASGHITLQYSSHRDALQINDSNVDESKDTNDST